METAFVSLIAYATYTSDVVACHRLFMLSMPDGLKSGLLINLERESAADIVASPLLRSPCFG